MVIGRKSIPLSLPITPGHEIVGRIEEIGNAVPQRFLKKGDAVAVSGGWGCGMCAYCKGGDEQSCFYANWPGIMTNGGGLQSTSLLILIDFQLGSMGSMA
jgi:propanol-preferring alcohol dehydrogenase